VILAIDTSLSMEATDVQPSRVAAAKEAAGRFLDSLPEQVAVGIVAFDGEARQLIAPTTRLDAVRRVIARADLGEGTAIGEAVFVALDSIASAAAEERGAGKTERAAGAIVLLSDGETTHGRSNEDAARAAQAQGIAVNTIAFGTDAGRVQDPLGNTVQVPVNSGALEKLARSTGGRALTAQTADELREVYEDLGRSVEVERTQHELTDWFAAAALVLVFLAGAGSLAWFGRLP
jgi:Ca-activated chloride channel family protein